MKMKEFLAGKITTVEQMRDGLVEVHRHNKGLMSAYEKSWPPYNEFYDEEEQNGITGELAANDRTAHSVPTFHLRPGNSGSTSEKTAYLPTNRWYVLREWLRLNNGLYELSSVLADVLMDHPWLAPHVSTQDRTMVAYTPDEAAGVRDAQVKLSMGKLLRRLYPMASDNVIRDLEEVHRSDLSNELEIIYDPQEFMEAYIAVSSCMGKTSDNFGSALKGHHPIEPYLNVPGLGLAVSRNSEKVPNARTLVYVNPDDPTDKRYVRIYGDGVLQRRLAKNGFQCKSLKDVELHKIVLQANIKMGVADRILMPYIDQPNGRGSTLAPAYYVMNSKDPKKVVLTDQQMSVAFSNIGLGGLPSAQTTAGYIELDHHHNASALEFTCALSGKRCVSNSSDVWMVLGEDWPQRVSMVEFRKFQTTENQFFHAAYAHLENGVLKQVYTQPGFPTFFHTGRQFVDTTKQREFSGYFRLDVELYPNKTGWVSMRETRVAKTKSGKSILAEDAVNIIVDKHTPDDAYEVITVHKSEIVPKKFVLVQRLDSKIPCYAEPTVPTVPLASRRKAVVGVHDLTELYDGQKELTRQVVPGYIGNVSYYYREGHPPTIDDPKFKEVLIGAMFVGDDAPPLRQLASQGQVLEAKYRLVRSLQERFDMIVVSSYDKRYAVSDWDGSFNRSWGRIAANTTFVRVPDMVLAADLPGTSNQTYKTWGMLLKCGLEIIAEGAKEFKAANPDAPTDEETMARERAAADEALAASLAAAPQEVRELVASTDELLAEEENEEA